MIFSLYCYYVSVVFLLPDEITAVGPFGCLGASLYLYGANRITERLFVLVSSGIAYAVAYKIEKIYGNENADQEWAKRYLKIGIILIGLLLVYAKIGEKVIKGVLLHFLKEQWIFRLSYH